MNRLKPFIENNFALFLLLGGMIGFFVPSSLGDASNYIIILLIALLVYFACPEIKKKELVNIDIFQVGVFSVVRFLVFPICLYYISLQLFPTYANGVLLLSLMPAAMAVASLCMIGNGKASLGITLTVITSLLTPVFVPAVFGFLGHQVNVNEFALFFTLIIVLFGPVAIYFGLKKKILGHEKWISNWGNSLSVLTMSCILLVVVATYKIEFVDDFSLLLKALALMFLLYTLYYGFGFLYGLFLSKEERNTYIWASGANNNGLAIGLSFIYLSPETTFFIVTSEIVWCLYVAGAQFIFSRRKI